MSATLTTIANILKKYYLPPVVDQLNNKNLLLQLLDVSSDEIVGDKAVVPLHTARAAGVGARAEGGALPDAGAQGFKKAEFDLTYQYGVIRVTGPMIEKSKTSAGAFMSGLQAEINGKRDDLLNDTARQFYADGTGKIATCGTTSSSTTVVLSSAEAIKRGHLYVNRVIDIGTLADPVVVASARTITATDKVNGTIVISGAAVTTSASHFIFNAGNAAASSVSYELEGLGKIVNSSTGTALGGLDPDTAGEEVWDNGRTNVNGAVTLSALQQAYNEVELAGGEVSVQTGSKGIERRLFDLVAAQQRFPEAKPLNAGYTSILVNGKPFVGDIKAPWGRVNLLDKEHLKIFANHDWHWMEGYASEGGEAQILHWDAGYDAWKAVLRRYFNMGTDFRAAHHVLYGITDTGV